MGKNYQLFGGFLFFPLVLVRISLQGRVVGERDGMLISLEDLGLLRKLGKA